MTDLLDYFDILKCVLHNQLFQIFWIGHTMPTGTYGPQQNGGRRILLGINIVDPVFSWALPGILQLNLHDSPSETRCGMRLHVYFQ